MMIRSLAVLTVAIAVLVMPQFSSAMDDAMVARLIGESRTRRAGDRKISPAGRAPEFALFDPIQPLKLDEVELKTNNPKETGDYELSWFDCYDWYNDGYVMGWSSRKMDLLIAPYVYNVEDTTVRLNFLQVGPRFRMHLDYLTLGHGWDYGPSLRIFKSEDGEWAVDAEPSFVDGRLGFVVKTPWGVAAKFRFDSVSNRQFIRDGLARGVVTGLALLGTDTPKGPMAQVAEHVAARTIVRWVLGAGNPIGHILVEGLLKRVFRMGKVFDKLFDGPNTPGLTVAKQTLADNGGIVPLKREPKKTAKRKH